MKNYETTLIAGVISLAFSMFSGGVLADDSDSNVGRKTECSKPLNSDPKEVKQLRKRGDIRPLPRDLCDQLVDIERRPHSLSPLPVFSEADDPSLLFSYYLP